MPQYRLGEFGENNAYCDRCGRKMAASFLSKDWNGVYVCPDCYDGHPAELEAPRIRAPKTPTIIRPEQVMAAETANICSLEDRLGIIGIGVIGCMRIGYAPPLSPLVLP